jgi:hypothetical protein
MKEAKEAMDADMSTYLVDAEEILSKMVVLVNSTVSIE